MEIECHPPGLSVMAGRGLQRRSSGWSAGAVLSRRPREQLRIIIIIIIYFSGVICFWWSLLLLMVERINSLQYSTLGRWLSFQQVLDL